MSVRFAPLLFCFVVLSTTLGSTAHAEDTPTPAPSDAAAAAAKPKTDPEHQTGNASYYAHHFRGKKTASGQLYDPEALTAAHRTLPMGTQLRVTNPKNDRSVIVTVNDRGRLPKGRVVDVSSAAADALEMKKSGVTKVETRIVGKPGALQPDIVKPEADAASAAPP